MEKLRPLMVEQPPEDWPIGPDCANYHIGRDHLM
jgi:hypothetical protein